MLHRGGEQPLTTTRRDYSTVTEVPGNRVSREAIDMVRTRYEFAGRFCGGKTVLEAACGPGAGLGYLSKQARAVVGGDYTAGLLSLARAHYGPRIPLVRLDAHGLPFRQGVFDVVVLFEAIYFLADAGRALESCRRVLAPSGTLIIVTVNPEWPAFCAAPFSTRYPSASELRQALGEHGFSAELFGGFPTTTAGARGQLMSALKRAAVRMGLIPKTMKGKEFLKRLVFGRLEPFPADITAVSGTYHEPVRLTDLGETGIYKVLYAVARKDAG